MLTKNIHKSIKSQVRLIPLIRFHIQAVSSGVFRSLDVLPSQLIGDDIVLRRAARLGTGCGSRRLVDDALQS